MRFFSKKSTKSPDDTSSIQPPSSQTPSSRASSQTPSQVAGTPADLAGSLSADVFRPEAREMLGQLNKKIKDKGIMRVSSLADAVQTDRPISNDMQNLLKGLSQKLFPHRHQTDTASVDAKALVENLREKLATAPKKTIEPPKEGPSSTAQTVTLDAAKQDTTGKSPALQGETKPEHASAEALANPFSLVNINRGAASGNSISPGITSGITSGSSDGSAKRRINTNANTGSERTTVSYKKKLLQLRFSRRRFLRDYNGTNLLAVIFMFLILVGFNGGTIFTNISVLIPQTKINQDAGKQAINFRNQIDRDTPKLSGLLNQRKANNERVNKALASFASTTDIRNDFSVFLNELDEDPRIEISEQTIQSEKNDLPKVENITVTFKAKTNFLLWLQYRNKFIRKIGEINVVEEIITAPAGQSIVEVSIKMSRPGKSA